MSGDVSRGGETRVKGTPGEAKRHSAHIRECRTEGLRLDKGGSGRVGGGGGGGGFWVAGLGGNSIKKKEGIRPPTLRVSTTKRRK